MRKETVKIVRATSLRKNPAHQSGTCRHFPDRTDFIKLIPALKSNCDKDKDVDYLKREELAFTHLS